MPDQTRSITNIGDAITAGELSSLPAGATITDRSGDTFTFDGKRWSTPRLDVIGDIEKYVDYWHPTLKSLPGDPSNGTWEFSKPDLYQQARIALRDRYGVEPLIDDVHAVQRVMEDNNLTPAAAVSAMRLAQADTIPDPTPAARHVDVSGLLDADFGVVVFVKDNDVAGLARLRAHAALDQLLDQHGISRAVRPRPDPERSRPMSERMIPVPESLIRNALDAIRSGHDPELWPDVVQALDALLSQPTPTAEPGLSARLAELQRPVNGHRPYCLSNQPGDGACNCDLAASPSIADMEPGTTFWAKDGKDRWRRLSKTKSSITSVVDLFTGQHFPAIHLDPSTIRDVQPSAGV